MDWSRSPWSKAVAAMAVLLAIGSTVATSAAAPALAITTVSNPKPQFISGDDVLVRVSSPAVVRANGRDVSPGFTRQPDGSLLGLVTGLRLGGNILTADASGRRAEIRVTAHALAGPVFSGPQQRPFYCETTAFGLAPATQPLCEAPTKVSYLYGRTTGGFAPLVDPASRPPDLATLTLNGRAVPYVVRLETGTIDRAVYQIAALDDGLPPSPQRPEQNWNGKLVYAFGGGCNGGHHQGDSTGNVANDLFLSQGYAVASSSLNVLETNCSTVISAEAAMMVKEHFIETYGPVRHTIGWGGSGGSIQQHDIVDAYPGVLDGIIPGASYPDVMTAFASVVDCSVLNTYFAGQGASLSVEQRAAIAGYVRLGTCASWQGTFLARMTPTGSCSPAIPPSAIWNPVSNPDGVKCAAAEQWVNQLGRDPRTGFVRSVIDNTGIQYGLSALRNRTISPGQFASLNAGVGGLDAAGNLVAQRSVADPRALDAAYRNDLIVNGGQGLRTTPIIDQRTYADTAGFPIDIHTSEMSFVMRDRLREANGTAANQVIIQSRMDPAHAGVAAAYELDAMDRWLTAIKADTSPRGAQPKVIANKPADLGDGCYLSAGERILEPLSYPPSGRCAAAYPVAANPRIVAGADVGMTTLKCALKPLNFGDYPVSFTAREKATLRQAFPAGVCDYTRHGVGQQPPRGTWLDHSTVG